MNHLIKVIDGKGNAYVQDAGGEWIKVAGPEGITDWNLMPGRGYFVKMAFDSELHIGEGLNSTRSDLISSINGNRDGFYENLLVWDVENNPPDPMTILITEVLWDGVPFDFESGDEIAVYDGEKCVGYYP